MAPMQFDAVEPCRFGPGRSCSELLDDKIDIRRFKYLDPRHLAGEPGHFLWQEIVDEIA